MEWFQKGAQPSQTHTLHRLLVLMAPVAWLQRFIDLHGVSFRPWLDEFSCLHSMKRFVRRAKLAQGCSSTSTPLPTHR